MPGAGERGDDLVALDVVVGLEAVLVGVRTPDGRRGVLLRDVGRLRGSEDVRDERQVAFARTGRAIASEMTSAIIGGFSLR
jgi:hypothetical protein